MNTATRIVVGIPGLLMLGSGIQWLVLPEAAATGLAMPLLEGAGRSTQIGDLGAFFFASAAMILLGVAKLNAQWLYGAAMLLGTAAVMRTAAWLLHDADFAPAFIIPEVVITAIILFGASRIHSEAGSN